MSSIIDHNMTTKKPNAVCGKQGIKTRRKNVHILFISLRAAFGLEVWVFSWFQYTFMSEFSITGWCVKNRCNFAFAANDRKRVEMYKILSVKQRQLHFEAGWWNTDTVFSLMSKIQMFWTFHLSHTVAGIRFLQICLHIRTPCYTEPSPSHQEYL